MITGDRDMQLLGGAIDAMAVTSALLLRAGTGMEADDIVAGLMKTLEPKLKSDPDGTAAMIAFLILQRGCHLLGIDMHWTEIK